MDRLLMAVGRRPLTRGLILEQAGVKADPKTGFIVIDTQCRTSIPSIYAVGAHIIGPRAANMIAECVITMEFGAGSEDIARIVHGHPTFAEALREAATAARACSIYAI